ncbi:glutaredoxin [Crepidotus variabilis]|uniref:Glutaredoxin n=1 Tax=Crepidotus variabilis TaxID=179855 RepID=A0A9P6E5C8_9AGAR|nr:glutaredoxin [Crepidotus variabilis]
MTTTNLFNVESSSDFQDKLSVDLNRVSTIYFWAPWAEPCRQMTEVVDELAKKHAGVLFLRVEAEEQQDITESFDIEAVPSFVILRGHTLLDRISGADAAALTKALGKHASKPAYAPLSKTSHSPAKASNIIPSQLDESQESHDELNTRLRRLMNQSKVVLFMKGSPETPRCGFSRKISTLLKDREIEFTHFDILTDDHVRQGLKVLNNWPTFPQLIVKGELVGGLDIVQEMAESGELQEAVA